jgi:hypothetical protein
MQKISNPTNPEKFYFWQSVPESVAIFTPTFELLRRKFNRPATLDAYTALLCGQMQKEVTRKTRSEKFYLLQSVPESVAIFTHTFEL